MKTSISISRRKLSGCLLGILLAVIGSMSMTSCVGDWGPVPPTTNQYDSRLNGYWQLVRINGYPIYGYDVNYMFFNGNGWGVYYYYLNNRRYSESLSYWCQNSVNNISYYQVNVKYQNTASLSTMNYSFSNGSNTLYLQWYDGGRLQTYTYTRYPYAPW